MFALSVPWWEFVLRGVAIYVFLFFILRVTGKRQVGQLAPFDLILLLILSNSVQNSMNAGDNSLVGGMISATTLVVLNWLVARASFFYPRVENFLEGEPFVLVRDGQMIRTAMADEKITVAELETALRLAGSFELENIKLAILENNGHVSVRARGANDPKS